MFIRRLTTAGALACALTCSFALPHSAAAQTIADSDAKEIASYVLTSAALAKVVNVNRALVLQMQQDPKVQEAQKVGAEIDALEKKDDLSEAEQTRLDALRERQDRLEDSIDNPLGGDTKTLAEMEARIRKYPPLVQALQKEGMTPREYARFWLAFIQAAFVHGFQKSGMLKELPPGVNPANVTFMQEHAAEIEAMQKEFEALAHRK